ncbi:RNA polymerase-binding protein DksA [bacterium]|nr:RNA polymerase-binding protein DksA [candidate division CSSED10-310 bacterium]
MDEKHLSYFKEKLLQWKQDLLKEVGVTIGENLARDRERQGDFGDLANIEADQNFMLRIRDRERKLIAKINRCLQQIEDGTYGHCQSCGEEIDVKRLEARPVASLCIACKTEQEKFER